MEEKFLWKWLAMVLAGVLSGIIVLWFSPRISELLDPTAYFDRGITKYESGDNRGAIAEFNEALRLKPDYPKAYYNRGLAKYESGDYQGAILDYTESIQINGNRRLLGVDVAHLMRGIAKYDLGDNQGALQDYTDALRLNPDYATAYFNRGLVHKKLGDRQSALTDFRSALPLYQSQGNTHWYSKAQKLIRELAVAD